MDPTLQAIIVLSAVGLGAAVIGFPIMKSRYNSLIRESSHSSETKVDTEPQSVEAQMEQPVFDYSLVRRPEVSPLLDIHWALKKKSFVVRGGKVYVATELPSKQTVTSTAPGEEIIYAGGIAEDVENMTLDIKPSQLAIRKPFKFWGGSTGSRTKGREPNTKNKN